MSSSSSRLDTLDSPPAFWGRLVLTGAGPLCRMNVLFVELSATDWNGPLQREELTSPCWSISIHRAGNS
eukprot:m.484482 g.484482  ORF g.484482 m.484482 type:complete len:69 (+) comp68985_c0_seq1:11-217(+)